MTFNEMLNVILRKMSKDLKMSEDSSKQLRVSHPTPSLAKQETGNLTTMRAFAKND